MAEDLASLIRLSHEQGDRIRAVSPSDVDAVARQTNVQLRDSNRIAQDVLSELSNVARLTQEKHKEYVQEREVIEQGLQARREQAQRDLMEANAPLRELFDLNRREITESLVRLEELEQSTPSFFKNPIKNVAGRVQAHFTRAALNKDLNDLAEVQYAMDVNRQTVNKDLLDYMQTSYVTAAAALNRDAQTFAKQIQVEEKLASLAINAADRNAQTAKEMQSYSLSAKASGGLKDEDLSNPIFRFIAFNNSNGQNVSPTSADIALAKGQFQAATKEQQAAIANAAAVYHNLEKAGIPIDSDTLLRGMAQGQNLGEFMASTESLADQNVTRTVQNAYLFALQREVSAAEAKWFESKGLQPGTEVSPAQEKELLAIRQSTEHALSQRPANEVLRAYFDDVYKQASDKLINPDGAEFTATAFTKNPGTLQTIAELYDIPAEKLRNALDSEEAKIVLNNPATDPRNGLFEKIWALSDILETHAELKPAKAMDVATKLARTYYEGKLVASTPQLKLAQRLGMFDLQLSPRLPVQVGVKRNFIGRTTDIKSAAIATLPTVGLYLSLYDRMNVDQMETFNPFDPVDVTNLRVRLKRQSSQE